MSNTGQRAAELKRQLSAVPLKSAIFDGITCMN